MIHSSNDPDKFYDEVIMPYKGLLEEWYVSNDNVYAYFSFIVLTIWVVLGFSAGSVWKLFADLPRPPDALNKWM